MGGWGETSKEGSVLHTSPTHRIQLFLDGEVLLTLYSWSERERE